MKRMFLSVFLITTMLSVRVSGQNEEGKSGTVYSSYGTGFPLLNNTAQEKSMGIMGVSFNDLGSPGLSNPAFWGLGSYSRVAANFDFTSYSVKDAFSSGTNSLLNVGSFQAVFPISKNKLGLSVALYPETRSSYNVNSEQSIPNGSSTLDYSSNRIGSGGVSKFEIGLGWNIVDGIAIGYAPSFSFLTEKETSTLSLLTGGVTRSTTSKRINGTSISHRFGVILSNRGSFIDDDILQIGGSVTLPTYFNATQEKTTTKIINFESTIVQIGDNEKADISLPLKVNGGISYFLNSRFNASAEVQIENWESAKYEFSENEESAFINRKVYGLGFQYHPYRLRSKKFLSNFKYSAGVSYDTGHLQISDKEINTVWLSAGLGLISPNLRSVSSFDISFQYGLRGTTSNSLVKENIFGISLSVNLTELMFLQRKLN